MPDIYFSEMEAGPELDTHVLVVAKGWRWLRQMDGRYRLVGPGPSPFRGKATTFAPAGFWPAPAERVSNVGLPSPSTDPYTALPILAAWQWNYDINRKHGVHAVYLWAKDSIGLVAGFAESESLPLAICRARMAAERRLAKWRDMEAESKAVSQ